MNRIGTGLLALSLLGSVGYAEHSPLLPRPQQVQYGSGSVWLRATQITFANAPNQADQFAAKELRSWLRERTGREVTIAAYGNSSNSAFTIVLDREGSSDQPLALPGDKPGKNSFEAYDLSVSQQGAKVHARSSAGIYYGAQTLRQLIEGSDTQAVLPVVQIHDWPSMAFRGTMVDISHGPLPRESEIERELDLLSRWKDNQYYLYNENSIELTGYPLLNPKARLSQDEVRRIVAYGRKRHIDVIPALDLYGHEHDLFRIEQYSDMSDQSHGTEFDARNPKALPLLADWANQFSDMFPSPFVSIGFDEIFQIKAAAQSGSAADPTALFVKQLTAVSGLFAKHGKHVMAYGDMLVKYPQIIDELPPGLMAVAWHSSSEDPTYKKYLAPLVAHQVPHFVQPGVKSYDQITPDDATAYENIDTFLAAGRKSGAMGLINSVWSDDAQLLLRMSYPSMAYGAAAPWQSVPMDRASFFSDYARQMYPAVIAPHIASALSNMAQAETDIQKVIGWQSMFSFWEDPFYPTVYKTLAAHGEDLHQTRMHAEQAETALYRALSLGADPATVNSLMIGSQLLDYAGQKFQTPVDLDAIWSKFGGKRPDGDTWWNEWGSQVTHYDHSYVTDLMDKITDLKPYYRAEWLEEYEPYRLGAALGRWDAEFQFWRGVHERLRHFNESTHQGDTLPPLEQVIENPQPSWVTGGE
ncbi:MAG: beta-N-acetylhexosaminidase [Acidobacteriaceae bacterium]